VLLEHKNAYIYSPARAVHVTPHPYYTILGRLLGDYTWSGLATLKLQDLSFSLEELITVVVTHKALCNLYITCTRLEPEGSWPEAFYILREYVDSHPGRQSRGWVHGQRP
jgi:hypothetical protein